MIVCYGWGLAVTRRGEAEGVMVIFLVIFLVTLCSTAQGGEMVVQQVNVAVQEDFNSFRGSMETLPVGWDVSSDGSAIMGAGAGFRGVSTGAVTAAGCYAWALGDGNFGLGCQPTADAFTPGFFIVAVSNSTGMAVGELSISYDVVCRNDQDRSSCLELELSLDGVTFDRVQQLTFVSTQPRDTNAVWQTSVRSCRMVLAKALVPGGCLWLRWFGNDVAGSGSRDEVGIDNLRLIFHYTWGTVICIQ